MAKWNGWILTTKGKALEAKVTAGESKLEFTAIQLGNGQHSDLASADELASVKKEIPVQGISIIDEETVCIETSMTNREIEEDLTVSEMGLIAKDTDGKEILYAIDFDPEPDIIPARGTSIAYEQLVKVYISITDTANVIINIDPSSVVTQGALQTEISKELNKQGITTYVKELEVANGALVTVNGKGERTQLDPASINMLQRRKVYEYGDIAYSTKLKSWQRLECVVGGETAELEPDFTGAITGLYLTDGEVRWIVDDVRDGTAVGSVRGGLYIPNGYVKANGATVLRVDYPRLVHLVNKYDLWRKNDDEWGLFGIADGETTFTLPSWTGLFVQYADSDIGKMIEAGLPNITGYVRLGVDGGNAGTTATGHKGAFIKNTDTTDADITASGRYTGGQKGLHFDASGCNSIYGASDTVQPPAIHIIPIIRY